MLRNFVDHLYKTFNNKLGCGSCFKSVAVLKSVVLVRSHLTCHLPQGFLSSKEKSYSSMTMQANLTLNTCILFTHIREIVNICKLHPALISLNLLTFLFVFSQPACHDFYASQFLTSLLHHMHTT